MREGIQAVFFEKTHHRNYNRSGYKLSLRCKGLPYGHVNPKNAITAGTGEKNFIMSQLGY